MLIFVNLFVIAIGIFYKKIDILVTVILIIFYVAYVIIVVVTSRI